MWCTLVQIIFSGAQKAKDMKYLLPIPMGLNEQVKFDEYESIHISLRSPVFLVCKVKVKVKITFFNYLPCF